MLQSALCSNKTFNSSKKENIDHTFSWTPNQNDLTLKTGVMMLKIQLWN